MKSKHTACRCLLSCMLLALTPALVMAEGPPASTALEHAEVRIPYTELKRLWESANSASKPAPPEPLPPGALMAAKFRATIEKDGTALEGDFKVESYGGKWERIKLMDAGPAVDRVEPADARLVVDGNALCVVAKDAGTLNLKVRFVKLKRVWGGDVPFLELATAPSAVASLQVGGLTEEQAVKSGESVLPADAAGSLTVPLPAKGGAVKLCMVDATLLPKPEPPPPPPEPSEWQLQNEAYFAEGEGELNYRVRSHLIAQNGSALEATLLLPTNARSIRVEGEDLADTRQARGADGRTEMKLRWRTRDQMERELMVSYALQQLPLAETWEVRSPSLATESQVKTLYMFALPPGVEFTAANLQGPVAAAGLPRWVGEESKALEYGTVSAGPNLTMRKRALPRFETAVAVVSKGDYTTRLMNDGSTLTEASLEIEHDDALRWSFTLPEKCELLKCAVNGASLKPILRENGAMELPISHGPSAKPETSRVTFSYTCAKGRLQAVEGSLTMVLPLTPLFIRELNWSLEIPESHEVTGIDPPDLAAAAGTDPAPNLAKLARKLIRNERPQVELFYRKRGID